MSGLSPEFRRSFGFEVSLETGVFFFQLGEFLVAPGDFFFVFDKLLLCVGEVSLQSLDFPFLAMDMSSEFLENSGATAACVGLTKRLWMEMPENFGDLHPSYGSKNVEVCPACFSKKLRFFRFRLNGYLFSYALQAAHGSLVEAPEDRPD